MTLDEKIEAAIIRTVKEHYAQLLSGTCKPLEMSLNPVADTHCAASWRSGDAADCKPADMGVSTVLLTKDVIQEYYDDHLVDLASGEERLKQLNRSLKKYLTEDFSSITQAMLRATLSQWKGATFNRYKVAINHLWAWAREREYTTLHPTISSKKEKARDTLLTLDQLRALYRAADDRGDWAGYCKLLILTGQRRGEVAKMTDNDIIGDEWHQPSSKNGMAHVVHLGPVARRVVEDGITWTGKTTFSDMKRRWFSSADVDPETYSLHDIRRSFTTVLIENGFDEGVVDRVLNHVAAATSRGTARVYNRAKLLKERKEVMLAWESILDPERVEKGEWGQANHPGSNMVQFGYTG